MTCICVICTLRRPPLTPLGTEHRRLLDAIVSPAITMADLRACEILVCADCQQKLQSVQQFQKMAVYGLSVLKSVLSKANNATEQDQKIKTLIQMEDGRKLLVNPISVVETVIKEPEMEEPSIHTQLHDSKDSQDMSIKSEPPATPEQPCLDVDLKLELQHEYETVFEPEIELKSEYVEFDSESEFDNASLSRSEQCDSEMKTEGVPGVQNIAVHTPIRSTLQTNHVYKSIENKVKPAILKQAHRATKEPKAAKVGIIARAYAAKQAKAALKASANAVKEVNVASEGANKIIEANVASDETHAETQGNIASEASDNADKEANEACTTENANAAVEKEKKRESKKAARVRCGICDKLLCHNRSLRQHFYLMHAEMNPVKCELCHKQFRNAGVLHYHHCPQKKGIPRPKPTQHCEECGVQFPSRAQYKAHLQTLKHTPRDLYKFECEVCKKRFRYKHWMRDHVDWIHRGLKKYSCERCDSSFGAFTSLRRHVARAHDRAAAPRDTHVCDLCGKTFKVKKSLEEHQLTHYGLRPFACGACPAAFSYRAALYTHTRLKHRGGKRKRQLLQERTEHQRENSGGEEGRDDEQTDEDETPQYLEFTFDD
ncbi:zinc finger protein 652-like [Cydia fagiglandana]|uniref:zinc finger protein 652-like n=1 Tax=Cydia fagiglandana TaxID=1458189 RepID=UPI002FEE16E0